MELKPCWFCKQPEDRKHGPRLERIVLELDEINAIEDFVIMTLAVKCRNCGAMGPTFSVTLDNTMMKKLITNSTKKAITAWNTRAESEDDQ